MRRPQQHLSCIQVLHAFGKHFIPCRSRVSKHSGEQAQCLTTSNSPFGGGDRAIKGNHNPMWSVENQDHRGYYRHTEERVSPLL